MHVANQVTLLAIALIGHLPHGVDRLQDGVDSHLAGHRQVFHRLADMVTPRLDMGLGLAPDQVRDLVLVLVLATDLRRLAKMVGHYQRKSSKLGWLGADRRGLGVTIVVAVIEHAIEIVRADLTVTAIAIVTATVTATVTVTVIENASATIPSVLTRRVRRGLHPAVTLADSAWLAGMAAA